MSWRDRYRKASFRGVEFYVRSIESGFGRSHAVHEYPLVDKPSTEDLGRNADEFTVEGYLLGADYDLQRDRLIAACRDTAGPGTLVHPYQGEKSVVCKGLRVRESSEDGGMCVLALTFTEAGELITPTVATDGKRDVKAKAASVIATAKASFQKRFSLASMPGFVVDAARTMVQDLSTRLGVKGAIRDLGAVADFTRQVQALNTDAEALISSPSDLADKVTSTLGLLRSAFSDSAGLLASLFDDYEGNTALAANTPSRRQEQANTNAFADMIRQAAMAEQAQAVMETTPASHQDAIGARDSVVDRLDTEAETTEDDDALKVLMALRASVARAIPAPAQTLPNLITYTPRVTVPSLVLAHQLYGDASRADEIVARNRIVHPAFVTGGRPLEVLSDG